MGYIYSITSPSGKLYVGKTIDLKDRVRKYRNVACKGQSLLYASINKYGWNAHIFKVLKELPNEELYDAEIKMIKELNTFNKNNPLGLNLTLGGDGLLGFKHKQEAINKMSINSTGKIHSEETKIKISTSNIGRVLPNTHPFKQEGRQDGVKNVRWGKGLIPVIQCDNKGKEVKEYKSVKDAAMDNGIFETSVSAVCNNRQKSVHGLFFKYKNTGATTPTFQVPIMCLFNSHTKLFNNSLDAAMYAGVSIRTVTRCISESRPTSKGIYFKKQRNQLN